MSKRRAKKLVVTSNFQIVDKLDPQQAIRLRKFRDAVLQLYGRDLSQGEDADQTRPIITGPGNDQAVGPGNNHTPDSGVEKRNSLRGDSNNGITN